MIKVGVTGGIGSGKSIVTKAFNVLGAPVLKADEEGKKALNEDPQLQEEVKETFGREVYGREGLNRKALADIVFGNPEKLQKLNQLVHPKVRERFDAFCREHSEHSYVIEEAAILIESGGYEQMDFLILVTAPEELRIQRVMERDNIDEATVRSRMKEQWNDAEKAPYADAVLQNDESELLLPRILELDREFRRKEAGGRRQEAGGS